MTYVCSHGLSASACPLCKLALAEQRVCELEDSNARQHAKWQQDAERFAAQIRDLEAANAALQKGARNVSEEISREVRAREKAESQVAALVAALTEIRDQQHSGVGDCIPAAPLYDCGCVPQPTTIADTALRALESGTPANKLQGHVAALVAALRVIDWRIGKIDRVMASRDALYAALFATLDDAHGESTAELVERVLHDLSSAAAEHEAKLKAQAMEAAAKICDARASMSDARAAVGTTLIQKGLNEERARAERGCAEEIRAAAGAQWACPKCEYFNIGPICTKCGALPSEAES